MKQGADTLFYRDLEQISDLSFKTETSDPMATYFAIDNKLGYVKKIVYTRWRITLYYESTLIADFILKDSSKNQTFQ
jgi:hypothetical protein